MKHFKAKWGKALHIISWCSTALLVTVSVIMEGESVTHPGHHALRIPGLLFLGLLLGCAIFTVRGYTIGDGTLLIHRLLWETKIRLGGLKSASIDSEAFKGALRTCGNGGLFSFTGFFWSKRLGSFRAYSTRLRRCVVLRIAKRTVVVSPEAPEEFVRQVTIAAGKD